MVAHCHYLRMGTPFIDCELPASQCGYPQYDGLQALYDSYGDKGLMVIGIPSNDFGKQEKGVLARLRIL